MKDFQQPLTDFELSQLSPRERRAYEKRLEVERRRQVQNMHRDRQISDDQTCRQDQWDEMQTAARTPDFTGNSLQQREGVTEKNNQITDSTRPQPADDFERQAVEAWRKMGSSEDQVDANLLKMRNAATAMPSLFGFTNRGGNGRQMSVLGLVIPSIVSTIFIIVGCLVAVFGIIQINFYRGLDDHTYATVQSVTVIHNTDGPRTYRVYSMFNVEDSTTNYGAVWVQNTRPESGDLVRVYFNSGNPMLNSNRSSSPASWGVIAFGGVFAIVGVGVLVSTVVAFTRHRRKSQAAN